MNCEPFDLLSPIAARAAAANPAAPSDYMENGVRHCGRCHTAKETVIMGRRVSCLCSCAEEAYNRAEAERKAKAEAERISKLRVNGIQDPKNRNACFENADMTRQLEICWKYVAQWEKAHAQNMGLLFWGAPGTGKTFAASCIANALIGSLTPVMQTSFSRILAEMQADAGRNTTQMLDGLSRFKLLVLDDFGVERQTPYTLQLMYDVIDTRYKNGQPLIVTTNISLQDIKNPANMAHQRIFERILEMCTPVQFQGESRRTAIAEEKNKFAAELLLN